MEWCRTILSAIVSWLSSAIPDTSRTYDHWPKHPWTLYSLRRGDSQRELKDTKEEKSKLKKWKWFFKTRRYLQLTLSPTHYPHFFSPGLCINWKTDDLPHYSLCFQLLSCQKLSVFSLNTQTSFCVTTKTFLVHATSTLFLRRHDFGRKDSSYWTSQKNCEAHVTSQTGNGNIFKSVFSYIASCYI